MPYVLAEAPFRLDLEHTLLKLIFQSTLAVDDEEAKRTFYIMQRVTERRTCD